MSKAIWSVYKQVTIAFCIIHWSIAHVISVVIFGMQERSDSIQPFINWCRIEACVKLSVTQSFMQSRPDSIWPVSYGIHQCRMKVMSCQLLIEYAENLATCAAYSLSLHNVMVSHGFTGNNMCVLILCVGNIAKNVPFYSRKPYEKFLLQMNC